MDLIQLDKPLHKDIAEFGAGFIQSTRIISDSRTELIDTYCLGIVPFEPGLSRMLEASKMEKIKLVSHFDQLKRVRDTIRWNIEHGGSDESDEGDDIEIDSDSYE